MDAYWDTKWVFIQAMTIMADQSKAIHCERLFDQKNIKQRKGEKTDGDKTGNQNVP